MEQSSKPRAKNTALTLVLFGALGVLIAGPVAHRAQPLDLTTTGSVAISLDGQNAAPGVKRPCVLFNSGRREGDC